MNRLKALLLRVAPDRLLFGARRLFYAHAVRRFSVPHVRVIRALVRPGDCALDLGANVGWYSRILSELVGPTGRVYSLEPVPPTFALLQRSVRKLRLDNVQAINSAASDRNGSITMEVPPYDEGGDNFYQAHIVEDLSKTTNRRQFRVSTTSVDALLSKLTRPLTFIKCDVEGHERAALRGAADVIRRWLPALLVEITTDPDDSRTSGHDLVSWLTDLGYRAFRFDGQGLVARQPGDRYVDYFFLTAHHMVLLKQEDVRVSEDL
jgi:FkbM family methyltransferase